jgi:hypothetical protein
MSPRWRTRYFVLSTLLAVAAQAALGALARVPQRGGCVVDPFDVAGLLLLAFIGANTASVALSACGALLWLRGGLRGQCDIDLAATSAFNALPLVYIALGVLGVRW